MSLLDPLARAKGHGSAKDGVGHWWQQRLSSIILLPLLVWLIFAALQLVGADFNVAREFVSKPLNTGLLIVLALALCYHAMLGLQVVIEDYIHGSLEFILQLLVKLAALAAAVTAVLTILRIASLLGGVSA